MSLAVKRYADALLDVCFEENCQDDVYTEFKLFYEQMRTDKEFERGYKERKNILEAEAVTAVEMTPEQVEKITEELAEKYGKTVVLKTSVDPSILGGMVLYVGNEMLDASVKARFEGLKKQLKTIQLQ